MGFFHHYKNLKRDLENTCKLVTIIETSQAIQESKGFKITKHQFKRTDINIYHKTVNRQ